MLPRRNSVVALATTVVALLLTTATTVPAFVLSSVGLPSPCRTVSSLRQSAEDVPWYENPNRHKSRDHYRNPSFMNGEHLDRNSNNNHHNNGNSNSNNRRQQQHRDSNNSNNRNNNNDLQERPIQELRRQIHLELEEEEKMRMQQEEQQQMQLQEQRHAKQQQRRHNSNKHPQSHGNNNSNNSNNNYVDNPNNIRIGDAQNLMPPPQSPMGDTPWHEIVNDHNYRNKYTLENSNGDYFDDSRTVDGKQMQQRMQQQRRPQSQILPDRSGVPESLHPDTDRRQEWNEIPSDRRYDRNEDEPQRRQQQQRQRQRAAAPPPQPQQPSPSQSQSHSSRPRDGPNDPRQNNNNDSHGPPQPPPSQPQQYPDLGAPPQQSRSSNNNGNRNDNNRGNNNGNGNQHNGPRPTGNSAANSNNEIEELRAQISELKDGLGTVRRESEDEGFWKGEYSRLDNDRRKDSQEHAKLVKFYTLKVSELEVELRSMLEQCDASDRKWESAVKETNELVEGLAAAELQVTESTRLKEEMQKKYKGLMEIMREEQEEHDNLMTSRGLQVEELERDLEVVFERAREATTQVVGLEVKNDALTEKLQAVQAQVSEALNDKYEVEANYSALMERMLSDKQKHSKQSVANSVRIEELEQELDEVTATTRHTKSDFSKAKQDLEQLAYELQSAQKHASEAMRGRHMAEQKYAKLVEKVQNAKAATGKKRARLASAKEDAMPPVALIGTSADDNDDRRIEKAKADPNPARSPRKKAVSSDDDDDEDA